MAFFRPLDDQVAVEQALRRSQRSAGLLARSTGSLLVLCRNGQIQALSEGAEGLLQVAAETLVGQPLQELVAPEERGSHSLLLQQAAMGQSLVGRSQLLSSDGRRLAVEVNAAPLEEGSGDLCVVYRLLASAGNGRDGASGAGATATGSPLTLLDPLTGLLKRGALFEQLQTLMRQRRQRDRIALLICDLDQMASINAQQGRDRGDLLLQTTAMRVRSSTRDGDLLGRLGGDELLVVLQNVGSLDVAIEVAEKIRRAVHEPIAGSGSGARALVPSLSIGVTLLAEQEDLDGALARADAATFAAKASGGNQVIVMPAGPAPQAIRSGTGSIRQTPRSGS